MVCSLLALTAACGGSPRSSVPPGPGPIIVADSTEQARVRREGSIHGDSEEMLHPDPGVRTWNRLWALRNWIRRYTNSHGELPTTLHEVLGPEPGPIDLLRDGWGNVILYSLDQGVYELRSAGRDRILRTSDDMFATADYLPPHP